jgi:hypothetical protein
VASTADVVGVYHFLAADECLYRAGHCGRRRLARGDQPRDARGGGNRRTARAPLLDLVGPAPYVGFQSALDSTVVHGWNYYWKSTHLPALRDDLIDVIVEHAFGCASPRSYVAMFHLQGAVGRVPGGARQRSATGRLRIR